MALFQRYCGHGITLDKECLACAALVRMDERRDAERKELRNLRLSVQRVGEMARTLGWTVEIPAEGTERGWNNLCGELVEHLLRLREEAERTGETCEEMVETIAKAMFDSDERSRESTTKIHAMAWQDVGDQYRNNWRERARASLSAVAVRLASLARG